MASWRQDRDEGFEAGEVDGVTGEHGGAVRICGGGDHQFHRAGTRVASSGEHEPSQQASSLTSNHLRADSHPTTAPTDADRPRHKTEFVSEF